MDDFVEDDQIQGICEDCAESKETLTFDPDADKWLCGYCWQLVGWVEDD